MTLTIELIDRRHSASIHELISDPEIAKTSDIPYPLPLEGASAWIERMLVCREQKRAFTYAMLVDSCLVGVCQLGSRDCAISDSGELGFFTGKAFWGRGYATEGSRLLLGLAFGELGLNSVNSSCLAWNNRAIRVLKKLGFQSTHTGLPPQGSKFPETELFHYWILTQDVWAQR
jgi:RimJ/RimL family protein N-acetyltransferase